MAQQDVQISLRFHHDDSLLKHIDQHLERLRRETPGVDFARTDAVKALIAQGLKPKKPATRADAR